MPGAAPWGSPSTSQAPDLLIHDRIFLAKPRARRHFPAPVLGGPGQENPDAYQKEQQLRGEGDAKAVSIYAEAFEKDAEFYGFLRTLEAYRKSLKTGTTLFLPPQSEFLGPLFKKY